MAAQFDSWAQANKLTIAAGDGTIEEMEQEQPDADARKKKIAAAMADESVDLDASFAPQVIK